MDLAARLNAIGGLSIGVSATNPYLGADSDQQLNTNSPFSTGFTPARRFFPLPEQRSGGQRIVRQRDQHTAAAGSTALQDGVYGVFIPLAQSYGGAGACVMAFSDLTPLETRDGAYAANAGRIGSLPAAAGANGACSMAVDLMPTISGPSAPAIGTPRPYTVVVTNQGDLASTDGTVVVTLPPNLVLAPSVPAGCTRDSDTQMTCDLTVLAPAGLAPGGSVSIPFSATPSSVVPGASISVAISGVTSESNTTNNSTQMPITGATAVPTLSPHGLMLLMLSMLGLVASRLAQLRCRQGAAQDLSHGGPRRPSLAHCGSSGPAAAHPSHSHRPGPPSRAISTRSRVAVQIHFWRVRSIPPRAAGAGLAGQHGEAGSARRAHRGVLDDLDALAFCGHRHALGFGVGVATTRPGRRRPRAAWSGRCRGPSRWP